MGEILQKLTPDRDLQCYFERPSAIATLSETSASGFTVSGTWRQQFDWAVVEWNCDNVIEHPALRNLPDGDLSGLTLSYVESRENCIPLDSTWYPTVDWPFLRIWADSGGVEQLYKVRLSDYATPEPGEPLERAWCEFELQGTPTPDDYVELAWLNEHYTAQVFDGQSLEDVCEVITQAVNSGSPTMTATVNETTIRLFWKAAGVNGNRIGVYGNVSGAGTASWSSKSQLLHGGVSPFRWRVNLDFSNLIDIDGRVTPSSSVRKLRWTYAADIQPGAFVRSEFRVRISEWTVTGQRRNYAVAGAGSRRVEDDANAVTYSGPWTTSRGNFSGGSIRTSTTSGAAVSLSYSMPSAHRLYLGTRRHVSAPPILASVDGGAPRMFQLALAGEDVLIRLDLGLIEAGSHSIIVSHAGTAGQAMFFDFFEMCVASAHLPVFSDNPTATLATDWDTDHSIAIAPERSAWLMNTLGFRGRANHYVGALWFYELSSPDNVYASATIQFDGAPEFGKSTILSLGPTNIVHQNLIGDTAESVATAFALELNAGSTALWAEPEGSLLTLHGRAMGTAGNGLAIGIQTNSETFTATPNSAIMAGGVTGEWRTDLEAMPRCNRAVRDWSRSFFTALKGYGIDVAAAFSMELQHGDPSLEAGIAQRYPNGEPALLNTPALQTNFSPTSVNFWKQVYLDMATIMQEAGCQPYLQFGEVQWWYFPAHGGMPLYDEYTTARFQATYGRPMNVIVSNNERPENHLEECEFLPALIGEFTDAVMAFVRQTWPQTRFEVLYPPDVNDFPLTRVINLPAANWSPSRLDCLKTENFTYTGNRDMNLAKASIRLPMELGFPRFKASHLVGIWDYTTPWQREVREARAHGVESIVLFALDQFCLIGYPAALERGQRRSFAR
jgi:hypothetical protein